MSWYKIQARDRSGTVLAEREVYTDEQDAARKARRLASRWIGATAHFCEVSQPALTPEQEAELDREWRAQMAHEEALAESAATKTA